MKYNKEKPWVNYCETGYQILNLFTCSFRRQKKSQCSEAETAISVAPPTGTCIQVTCFLQKHFFFLRKKQRNIKKTTKTKNHHQDHKAHKQYRFLFLFFHIMKRDLASGTSCTLWTNMRNCYLWQFSFSVLSQLKYSELWPMGPHEINEIAKMSSFW